MEAEERRKMGKAREHLSCETSGGHEVDVGGEGPRSNNKASVTPQDFLAVLFELVTVG